jgi:2-polyprenyl-6-methoxyphenol hydroxylase-like FAD-dependent oxidoreductase
VRVAVIGGGPAGLYAAWSIRNLNPRAEVTVWERQAPRETEGFGVIVSRSALARIALRDRELADGIIRAGASFASIQLLLEDARERIASPGFTGIERAVLLGMLHDRCRRTGVTVNHRRVAPPVAELAGDADVVVIAEGVGSPSRDSLASRFGTRITEHGMHYTWLGTSRHFDDLTFGVQREPGGTILTHAYPYSPDRSTFLVELTLSDPVAAGVCEAGDPGMPSVPALERLLAGLLRGHPLLANRSRWRRFRLVQNDAWWTGNIVLVGDAAHSTHYSIGSGTKLALDDAVALSESLAGEASITEAFMAYEAARRPVVERAQDVAERSRLWFESIGDFLYQPPAAVLVSLVTRGGSIDFTDLELADGDYRDRTPR